MFPSIRSICQNGSKVWRASHFSVWTEYLVFGFSKTLFWVISSSQPKTIARTTKKYGARAIFRSRPNIWFLKSSEGRFETFLALGLKPLPERLKSMARELFFGLDRIFGFWTLQKGVLEHFWMMAQNHCQNGSKVWRASHFFDLERISGFWTLQKAVLKHFWLLAQKHCRNGSKEKICYDFSMIWIKQSVFWRVLAAFQKWS